MEYQVLQNVRNWMLYAKGVLSDPSLLLEKDYSSLRVVSPGGQWSLANDMTELLAICRNLGAPARGISSTAVIRKQCLFYLDRYFMLGDSWMRGSNRIAMAYYHGKPGTGYPEFDRCYEALCSHHEKISRIHAPNREIEQVLLGSGIAAQKIHVIPIGVNLSSFLFRSAEDRTMAREKWQVPHATFVVGSFQKDGCGWGEGDEPKLVKGPDVFMETMLLLKDKIPELFVLLTGPARGYVKKRLEAAGIPYRHVNAPSFADISSLYHALDLYVVSSREEGGPKAVLEAMASGVPLVSTRVGQATDLVRHGENGWLAAIEDSEELAYWSQYVYDNSSSLDSHIREARLTAEMNSYISLSPLWKRFLTGFVEGLT